jgi:hypothetical protein
MTSIDTTVLFGLELALVEPAAPLAPCDCDEVSRLPAALPAAPAAAPVSLLLVPALPELPALPVMPAPPLLEPLPAGAGAGAGWSYPDDEPEVPAAPEVPCAPLAGAPELVSPLAPELPWLLPPRMELQADTPNANASKPAKTTLWCFCFMIDSLCWNFSVGVRDDAACHFGKRREQERRSS